MSLKTQGFRVWFLLMAASAFASDRAWDGGSTIDSKWSPAANKDDAHVSGPGVLTVLRDDFGTLIKLQ